MPPLKKIKLQTFGLEHARTLRQLCHVLLRLTGGHQRRRIDHNYVLFFGHTN